METERFRRRHLPHWDVPAAAYFVTACLAGSIPACGLLDIARFTEELEQHPRPTNLAEDEWRRRLWKRAFVRVELWLDQQPGNRALEDPRLARIVTDALYHFAGERYELIAYVVMPSHIHWVFRPLPAWAQQANNDGRSSRERIMYSVKRFTARACNRLRKTQGTFWQAESYDHWIRDIEEMERIIRYVEENPVKAGLASTPEKWQFSSARDRMTTGLEFGVPLRQGRSGSES